MFVPVDPDAAVIQSLVTSVERNVLTNAFLVVRNELLDSAKRRLFFDREHEYQIGLRFDAGFVERANGSKYRFDIARVVSNARRKDFAVANLRFDLQAILKHRVEMRINYDRLRAAGAFAY